MGWIRLHRSIKDSTIWTRSRGPYDLRLAWIDMLLRANWKDTKVPMGSQWVTVPRGSLLCSERGLASDWHWSQKRVQTFLKLLENDSMIVARSSSYGTIISITNWEQYQSLDDETESKKNHCGITGESPRHRSEEDKEYKKGRSKNVIGEQSPLWTDCQYLRLTELEAKRIQSNYADDKHPPALFAAAVAELEEWLDNGTPKALSARKQATHAKRFHAPWVIENAYRRLKANGNGNQQQRFTSAAERKRERETALIQGTIQRDIQRGLQPVSEVLASLPFNINPNPKVKS